jgi:thiosulfate dehydrogenase
LKHAQPPVDTSYSSRIAPAAASAFFPSSKTHGNRRIAVLFSLLHFYRICLRIASMPKKGTTMKGFLVGLILGLLIVPIALFFYVETGQAPAAASDSPMPFEKFLARGALHARIKKETQDRELSAFNAGDLAAGADVYRTNCAFCHGLPLQAPSAASQGMFPHAPQLFTAKETVTDDPLGVTYWKVKNGIRLTGMPGFQKALSDQQMWQVAALMASADKLPPDVLRNLLPAPVSAASAAPGATAVPTPALVLPPPPSPSQPK